MPRRDRSRRSRSEADTVGFAGWLYADLFLLLFVVGLAMSVVLKDAKEVIPPRPTTTTSTTTIPVGPQSSTTTTTPVCSSLLNTTRTETNDFDTGIYIELRENMSDESLRGEFLRQLAEKSSGYPELDGLSPARITLGFVLIYGGNDSFEELKEGVGRGIAKKMVERLKELIPGVLFDPGVGRSAVFRISGTLNLDRGVVGFDVYPLVQAGC